MFPCRPGSRCASCVPDGFRRGRRCSCCDRDPHAWRPVTPAAGERQAINRATDRNVPVGAERHVRGMTNSGSSSVRSERPALMPDGSVRPTVRLSVASRPRRAGRRCWGTSHDPASEDQRGRAPGMFRRGPRPSPLRCLRRGLRVTRPDRHGIQRPVGPPPALGGDLVPDRDVRRGTPWPRPGPCTSWHS